MIVTLDGNVLNAVFYMSGKVVIEKATRSECNAGEPLFFPRQKKRLNARRQLSLINVSPFRPQQHCAVASA